MYEEDSLWYAVFDEEQYSDFPVKAGTEDTHDTPLRHTITTYEVDNDNSVLDDQRAYLALATGSSNTDLRVVAKTRYGAYAAMIYILDTEVL